MVLRCFLLTSYTLPCPILPNVVIHFSMVLPIRDHILGCPSHLQTIQDPLVWFHVIRLFVVYPGHRQVCQPSSCNCWGLSYLQAIIPLFLGLLACSPSFDMPAVQAFQGVGTISLPWFHVSCRQRIGQYFLLPFTESLVFFWPSNPTHLSCHTQSCSYLYSCQFRKSVPLNKLITLCPLICLPSSSF